MLSAYKITKSPIDLFLADVIPYSRFSKVVRQSWRYTDALNEFMTLPGKVG